MPKVTVQLIGGPSNGQMMQIELGAQVIFTYTMPAHTKLTKASTSVTKLAGRINTYKRSKSSALLYVYSDGK